MEIIALKQRHCEAFTAAIRKQKPEDVGSILELPTAEYNGVGLRAAFAAGWFAGDDLPDNPDEWIGDLTYNEADKWAGKVWDAWKAATVIDPNS